MTSPVTNPPIYILLADDDADDRFFFGRAIRKSPFRTELIACHDGVLLIEYLQRHKTFVPDVIFLDQNMPRKRGTECLIELKDTAAFRDFPVIIYSTHFDDDVGDSCYTAGAHYFIRKTNFDELCKILQHVLARISEHKLTRPSREDFLLTAKG